MTSLKKTSVEILMAPDFFGYYLRFARFFKDGNMEVGRIVFEPHERGKCAPLDARIPLTNEDLQDLLDNLWVIGLRPSTKLNDTKGVLAATEKHLEDMRTLVFKPTLRNEP